MLQNVYLNTFIFMFQIFLQVVIIVTNNILLVIVSLEMIFYSSLALSFLNTTNNSSHNIVFYFLNNLVGGVFILVSFVSTQFSYFLLVGLLIKLSLAPGLIWLPDFLKYLNWLNVWWFTTLQKLVYFLILSSFSNSSDFTVILVINGVIASIFMLNNLSNWKKLLGYSSIIDSVIIILLIQNEGYVFGVVYMLLYSIINLYFCYSINSNNINLSPLLVAGFPPSPVFFIKVFLFVYTTTFINNTVIFFIPILFVSIIQMVSFLSFYLVF